MYKFCHGNILDAPAEALVNPVNCVGVMGKGLALEFKNRFPGNFAAYQAACNDGQVRIGQMFVTSPPLEYRPDWIVNFPTKDHWRSSSQLEWIEKGVVALAIWMDQKKPKSIAIPPLGCGLGGLDWADVRPLLMDLAVHMPETEVLIYGAAM